MITISDLEKYDLSGMYKIYDHWPQIAKEAYNSELESIDFKNIDHVVFSGMGGSGTIGDVFSAILSKTNVHVNVVKGYLLPKTVNSKTLVVVTSISGNTDESISTLNSAIDLGCKIIAFSSGGKIEKICQQHNVDFHKIEKIHSPRASFVTYLYTILKTLQNLLPLEFNDVANSILNLESLSDNISSHNLTESNQALSLAYWLNSIPAIYFPAGLQSTAIRFKNSLQENVKNHAFVEDIIEFCHNGIVSWEINSSVQPILIQGIDDYIKTKERWKIVKTFFKQNNIAYKEIHTISGNILSKIVCLIYLFDYSTIYLACKNKNNPSPVKSIDFIKDNL